MKHERRDQPRAQADERQPAHGRRRARRSTVSGSATRTYAIVTLARTATAAYMRPDARRVALPRGRCLRPTARAAITSSRVAWFSSVGRSAAATSESPSTWPSAAMNVTARAPARRARRLPRPGHRSRARWRAGPRRAAPDRAALSRMSSSSVRRASIARRAASTTASASALASSTPRNVRVRKVMRPREPCRRACSRTA